jgi:hypothetical protein
VSLRIAFDLDGVLADMDGELLRQASALFGHAAVNERPDALPPDIASSPADFPADPTPAVSTLNLSDRQMRRLWRHVQSIENFWGTLQEIEPGVVRRLAQAATERRWEVLFLTKRPESAGPTAQVQTQRWLEAKGFPLPSVYVVQGSRGRIASALALDFVIDDRHENCLDVVVDSKARAVLVWREEQGQLPAAARRLGIGVVASVAECIEILKQADIDANGKPGMMERVMRLLGLRELT